MNEEDEYKDQTTERCHVLINNFNKEDLEEIILWYMHFIYILLYLLRHIGHNNKCVWITYNNNILLLQVETIWYWGECFRWNPHVI